MSTKPKSMDILAEALRRGKAKDVFQWTVADTVAARCNPWDTYWAAEVLIQALPDQAVHALQAQLALYAAGAPWPQGLVSPHDPEERAFATARAK